MTIPPQDSEHPDPVAEQPAQPAQPAADPDGEQVGGAADGAADGQADDAVDGDVIDAELVPDPVIGGPPVAVPAFDYTDDGVPTLDYLRDRIERRLGTAQGAAELAEAAQRSDGQAVRSAEDLAAERERRAAQKLAEIRGSLPGQPPSG